MQAILRCYHFKKLDNAYLFVKNLNYTDIKFLRLEIKKGPNKESEKVGWLVFAKTTTINEELQVVNRFKKD